MVTGFFSGISLPKGVHISKFRFKIPEGTMPSSFSGCSGKVVYMIEAVITRSWRWPSKVQREIKFISKSFQHTAQVMCPQSGSVSKKMSGLSKGEVQLTATINRRVCFPGETLSVVAKIHNSSSKDTKPKFKLQQQTVYRAGSSTKYSEKTLFKMVGDTVSPNSVVSASCQMKIPHDVQILQNCDIISVEYCMKVYLDISFAFDPEVVFPLVIIPSRFAAMQSGEAGWAYPPGVAGAPSYSDFISPAFPAGFDPGATGSGAYQYPALDPTQHANITSGNYNQWPQGAASQGFSAPAFTSHSMHNPGPTALPRFQQEEQPPTYASLYPPPH
ncbi:arrestin domain-containing protein 3-like isoform X2 [Archocentrus centrarchus]|uniref:arrestin domain-containing protein 3-like isoform X2 n=1 Tax=Archocentrus centrarchus TaxID=63155 RepID=UPI0011EA0FF4|nr:arrestin domain-containing protein 3-like isoform X2 [Archocentrus centrarchus]